jgi:hypothetical protein
MEQALALVRSRASAAEKSGCPADAFAREERDTEALHEYCQGKAAWCAERCFATDATACYSLALVLQDAKHEDASEPLFYRACTQGVTSGCTNRAARMLVLAEDDPSTAACAARTFERACDRSDPWACTMHAHDLLRAPNAEQKLGRIREALARGCRYGEKDPACQAAQKVRKLLEALEAKRP